MASTVQVEGCTLAKEENPSSSETGGRMKGWMITMQGVLEAEGGKSRQRVLDDLDLPRESQQQPTHVKLVPCFIRALLSLLMPSPLFSFPCGRNNPGYRLSSTLDVYLCQC